MCVCGEVSSSVEDEEGVFKGSHCTRWDVLCNVHTCCALSLAGWRPGLMVSSIAPSDQVVRLSFSRNLLPLNCE